MNYTLITLALCFSLAACSSHLKNTYEDPDTIHDLTVGKKPIWSSGGDKSKSLHRQGEIGQYQNDITVPPKIHSPGEISDSGLFEKPMSFSQWKKAKEQNSAEYQAYLEYLKYLEVLNDYQQRHK